MSNRSQRRQRKRQAKLARKAAHKPSLQPPSHIEEHGNASAADNKSKQKEQKQSKIQIANTQGLRRAAPIVLPILVGLFLGLASILWNDRHVLASHIATWTGSVLVAAWLAIIYDNYVFKRRLPRRRAKIAWWVFGAIAFISVPVAMWYHGLAFAQPDGGQRAWVNIRAINLVNLAANSDFVATITLENVGATPAVLTSWGAMTWFQESPEEWFEKVKNHHRGGIEEVPSMSLALGPHATTEFHVYGPKAVV